MKIKDLFKETKKNERAESLSKDFATTYSKAYKIEDVNRFEKEFTENWEKVTLKESSTNFKEKDFQVAKLGAFAFKISQFKDELKTPHYEIQKSLEAFEEIPNINEGIQKIILFITGNKIKITSEDEYTTEWYEQWIKQRPEIYNKIKTIIMLCEITGNSWIEPIWDKVNEDTVYMNDFEVVPDPSRVYYNLGQEVAEDNYWIYQVPYIFRKYGDMNISIYKITYIKNGIGWQETVYGIPLKQNDLIHFKVGWNRHGYYGRSYLASAIDSSEILQQMLKNYAIASRYMVFGKKIFSVGDENQEVPSTELKEITNILNSPEDEEHIVLNKKINSTEITPTQFNEMSGPMEFIRKSIGSGMEPAFMTPWAETVTYASANKATIPFELSLENKRQTYIDMLNRYILENVRRQNPKLRDATFEFGNVTLDDPIETKKMAIEFYNNDLITLNQLLKELNYDTVENGDIYKSKRNYIMQQKYQMTQTDVERFDEPYIQRKIQQDAKKEEEERGQQIPLQESAKLKESVVMALKFIETDKDFAKEFEKKELVKIEEVVKKEIIKESDIVRLCKTNGKFFIVNNLMVLNEKIIFDLEVAKKIFDLEVEKIKLQYDNFVSGETEEDQLTKELFKKMKEIQWEIAQEVMDEIKTFSAKEKFYKGKKIFKEKNVLNPRILNTLDGLFDRFNARMKSVVEEIIDKSAKDLGVSVEIVDDLQETSEIDNKKNMIKNLIFSQFQTFNQEQSQNIKRKMTDGILSGKSIADIKQELKDEVINWKKRAPSDADYRIDRIAHTEVHRASLQLKLLQWEKLGIKYVKYMAHIDDATRPEHRKQHNKIFTIENALKMPEWKEINCRCVFFPLKGI